MSQISISEQAPKGILTQPNVNFVKSNEGISEYQKLGLAYPNTYIDKAYEEFLQATREGDGNQYSQKNKIRIIAITRFRLAPGKEYLYYNQIETRFTPLDNAISKARLRLGIYPVIETKNEVRIDPSGYRQVIQVATGTIRNGYSIPYNLGNIDKLHQNAVDNIEYDEVTGQRILPTQYYVKDSARNTPVSIQNWTDFRDGDFDDLQEFGKKIRSKKEGKAIKNKIEEQRSKLANDIKGQQQVEEHTRKIAEIEAVRNELEAQKQQRKQDYRNRKRRIEEQIGPIIKE